MMSTITNMDAFTPPDFESMCTAIAAAGRDAMNPDAGNLPAQFERALRELMGVRADGIRWKHYSKQDLETRCKAHRVRRIAEREIGRLLAAMVEAGLRTAGRATEGHKAGAPTGLPTLDDLGIDRVDSQKWQKLARLSDEEFEAMLTGEIARLTTPRRRSSSAGPKIQMIDLTSIAVPSRRLRRLQREKVAALAKSMRDQGLINPITLRPGEEGRYPLIAGHHRYLAACKLEWEKIPAIIHKGLDAVDAELCEIDENLIRADLTPAEKAAHHARRKELHERKYPETVSVTKRGGPGRGKKNGRQNGEGFADRYTKDAAEKTGDSERTVQRHVERGQSIPNVAELAGTSLDRGAELDALAKLEDIAPDRRAELVEKAKTGEKVSARAEIKKAQQEKREAELGDAAEPELPFKPGSEQSESAAEPVSREDALAAQNLAPAPKTDVPPTAPDQPTPTAEQAAMERKALYARNEETAPDGDGDPVGNLIFLVEHQINGLVPEMRAAGRLPELFRRCREVIDRLEAEAAADGDRTEDCAESAAIERATPTQEEMPPSPAA